MITNGMPVPGARTPLRTVTFQGFGASSIEMSWERSTVMSPWKAPIFSSGLRVRMNLSSFSITVAMEIV